MTKRELIKRYLDSIGMVRVSGDTAEPLLPFLLGDAIYTIYNRDIARLNLAHEEKRLRKSWDDAYGKFNRPFFSAIGDGSEDATDLMDGFEEFIANDLMVLRSELMLLMQDVPFEKRGIIVSALLCHVLAQAAQIAWGNVYRSGRIIGRDKQTGRKMVVHEPDKNPYLETINRCSFRLAAMWHRSISTAFVDTKRTKGIQPAINALCRKMYKWLEQED